MYLFTNADVYEMYLLKTFNRDIDYNSLWLQPVICILPVGGEMVGSKHGCNNDHWCDSKSSPKPNCVIVQRHSSLCTLPWTRKVTLIKSPRTKHDISLSKPYLHSEHVPYEIFVIKVTWLIWCFDCYTLINCKGNVVVLGPEYSIKNDKLNHL